MSGHHSFIIDQGYPNITVDPGDSCVIILGNHGLPNFTDIIPPFQWPEDKFQGIGPFGGNHKQMSSIVHALVLQEIKKPKSNSSTNHHVVISDHKQAQEHGVNGAIMAIMVVGTPLPKEQLWGKGVLLHLPREGLVRFIKSLGKV